MDYLIECPFTPEVMCMEPKAFIEWMVNALHARCFVIGNDFRFGHNRAGDYEVLRQYAVEFGYEVVVLDKIQEDGRDISSTYIREEIGQGHIEKANNLLGYEFFAKSMIIHGKQLGRKIGIPTINMEFPPEKLLPPNGVYVTRVLMDGVWHKGVTNVGCKPTVSDSHLIGVETHILDFSGCTSCSAEDSCQKLFPARSFRASFPPFPDFHFKTAGGGVFSVAANRKFQKKLVFKKFFFLVRVIKIRERCVIL